MTCNVVDSGLSLNLKQGMTRLPQNVQGNECDSVVQLHLKKMREKEPRVEFVTDEGPLLYRLSSQLPE